MPTSEIAKIIFLMCVPYALYAVILRISIKKIKPSTDHFYHLRLIEKIRLNGHRFITKSVANNEGKCAYPQLIHWFLSFLPSSYLEESAMVTKYIPEIIQAVCLNAFLVNLYINGIVHPLGFLLANLVFVLCPYSNIWWNAKNTGISMRGFGVCAGQMYLYLIILSSTHPSGWMLVVAALLDLIIILSSQFSTQFVLISIIPISILFKTVVPIAALTISTLLLFALFPRYAVQYLSHQYYHKKNYATWIADIFILKSRPSIYKDFFWGFRKKIKEKGFKEAAWYIYTNPVIEVILHHPALVILLLWGNNYNRYIEILYFGIYSAIFCFICTSLKKLRFLGEPQRYLEFCIPQVSILACIVLPSQVLIIIIFYSIIMLCINLILIPRLKLSNNKNNYDAYHKIRSYIKSCNDNINEDIICLSQDNHLSKFLLMKGVQVYYPELTKDEKKEELLSLYKNNLGFLSIKYIKRILSEVNVRYIFINIASLSESDSQEFLYKYSIHEVFRDGHIVGWKIDK